MELKIKIKDIKIFWFNYYFIIENNLWFYLNGFSLIKNIINKPN